MDATPDPVTLASIRERPSQGHGFPYLCGCRAPHLDRDWWTLCAYHRAFDAGVRASSSTSCPQSGQTDGMEVETYSTDEAAELAGVTVRMVDYWLRQGMIRIAHDARGSGSRRRFTPDEVAALARVVRRYRAAQQVLANHQRGELWSDEISRDPVDA